MPARRGYFALLVIACFAGALLVTWHLAPPHQFGGESTESADSLIARDPKPRAREQDDGLGSVASPGLGNAGGMDVGLDKPVLPPGTCLLRFVSVNGGPVSAGGSVSVLFSPTGQVVDSGGDNGITRFDFPAGVKGDGTVTVGVPPGTSHVAVEIEGRPTVAFSLTRQSNELLSLRRILSLSSIGNPVFRSLVEGRKVIAARWAGAVLLGPRAMVAANTVEIPLIGYCDVTVEIMDRLGCRLPLETANCQCRITEFAHPSIVGVTRPAFAIPMKGGLGTASIPDGVHLSAVLEADPQLESRSRLGDVRVIPSGERKVVLRFVASDLTVVSIRTISSSGLPIRNVSAFARPTPLIQSQEILDKNTGAYVTPVVFNDDSEEIAVWKYGYLEAVIRRADFVGSSTSVTITMTPVEVGALLKVEIPSGFESKRSDIIVEYTYPVKIAGEPDSRTVVSPLPDKGDFLLFYEAPTPIDWNPVVKLTSDWFYFRKIGLNRTGEVPLLLFEAIPCDVLEVHLTPVFTGATPSERGRTYVSVVPSESALAHLSAPGDVQGGAEFGGRAAMVPGHPRRFKVSRGEWLVLTHSGLDSDVVLAHRVFVDSTFSEIRLDAGHITQWVDCRIADSLGSCIEVGTAFFWPNVSWDQSMTFTSSSTYHSESRRGPSAFDGEQDGNDVKGRVSFAGPGCPVFIVQHRGILRLPDWTAGHLLVIPPGSTSRFAAKVELSEKVVLVTANSEAVGVEFLVTDSHGNMVSELSTRDTGWRLQLRQVREPEDIKRVGGGAPKLEIDRGQTVRVQLPVGEYVARLVKLGVSSNRGQSFTGPGSTQDVATFMPVWGEAVVFRIDQVDATPKRIAVSLPRAATHSPPTDD